MNVFLSWSDERSRHIAEALRIWLPKVMQNVKPWMSDIDISAGSRWLTEISTNLDECTIGIICVTPENQHNPWLQFEAGALSKTLEQTCVCPLVYDMKLGQLSGPLTQFQANELTKSGLLKVLMVLNKNLPATTQIIELEEIVDVWWPKLEEKLSLLNAPVNKPVERTTSEQLDEILSLARENMRRENIRLEQSVSLDARFQRMVDFMENIGDAFKLNTSNMQSVSEVFSNLKNEGLLVNSPSLEGLQEVTNRLSALTGTSFKTNQFGIMIDEVRAMASESQENTKKLLGSDDGNLE